MIRISNIQESDKDVVVDIPPGAIRYILLILLFIGGICIGYLFMPEKEYSSDDQIVDYIEGYLEIEHFRVASIELNENMTIRDIRNMYNKFKNQPTAKGLLVSTVRQFCGGID